jgi:hypothetical protein
MTAAGTDILQMQFTNRTEIQGSRIVCCFTEKGVLFVAFTKHKGRDLKTRWFVRFIHLQVLKKGLYASKDAEFTV